MHTHKYQRLALMFTYSCPYTLNTWSGIPRHVHKHVLACMYTNELTNTHSGAQDEQQACRHDSARSHSSLHINPFMLQVSSADFGRSLLASGACLQAREGGVAWERRE